LPGNKGKETERIFEVRPWGSGKNCKLSLKTSDISNRQESSEEINQKHGEGGGLNADYRTAEAIAVVSSALGSIGFKYGERFLFKTAGLNEIIFEFDCPENREAAERIINKLFAVGEIPLDIQATARELAEKDYDKKFALNK